MLEPAWLLNLDAEQELASVGSYAPKQRLLRTMQHQLDACTLLTRDEPIYGRQALHARHSVFSWCPTPSALRQLRDAQLNAVEGPALDVLRRANHRRFNELFAAPELERRYLTGDDDWQSLLFGSASHTGTWRLKRGFGMAGRWQRRLPKAPSADDVRWVHDSMRLGGLLREAELAIEQEFSTHGFVDAQVLLLGQPVQFESNRFGVPGGFRPAALAPALANQLLQAAESVALALRAIGYFGPFGVDAFTWSEGRVNAVSDINARFTLAWSLGMAEQRSVALERYARQYPQTPSLLK